MTSGFDMATVQRGARLKRSPFFDATHKAGCRGYTVYNHMFLPIAYDDLEAEYWKLLNEVTARKSNLWGRHSDLEGTQPSGAGQ